MWNLLSMLRLDHPKFLQITIGASLVLHGTVLLCFCVRYASAVTLRITQSTCLPSCRVRVFSEENRGKSVQSSAQALAHQKIQQKKKPVKKVPPVQKQVQKRDGKNKIKALVKKEEKKSKSKKIEKLPDKKTTVPMPEKKIVEPKPVVHEHPKVSEQASEQARTRPVETEPSELTLPLESSGAQGPQEGVHSFVYARIREKWKPPRGIKPRSACKVRALIGKGKVEGLPEIVTSSGNVLFDMAARRALIDAVYPADIWNRVLIIHFS